MVCWTVNVQLQGQRVNRTTQNCQFPGISQGEQLTCFKSSLASLLRRERSHQRGRAGRSFLQLMDKYINQKLAEPDLYLDAIPTRKPSICTATEQNHSWESNRFPASHKLPRTKFIAAFTTARHLSLSLTRSIPSLLHIHQLDAF